MQSPDKRYVIDRLDAIMDELEELQSSDAHYIDLIDQLEIITDKLRGLKRYLLIQRPSGNI